MAMKEIRKANEIKQELITASEERKFIQKLKVQEEREIKKTL